MNVYRLEQQRINGIVHIVHPARLADALLTIHAKRIANATNTHAGEREVKIALRKTLFKYKLHLDTELFERAYGYIREDY
jgi:type I restriction enzyme, R subunit